MLGRSRHSDAAGASDSSVTAPEYPPPVKYGLGVLNFWTLGEPAMIQRIAREAEDAGWDGLFTWDHVSATWEANGVAIYDPWILLAGAACVTERLVLGTTTPVPRRRPHVLAMQVATLDHLSKGRATMGVGLGGEEGDFVRFGESFDAKRRASMLDEALEVITALWSGEVVHHRGEHYVVDGVRNLLGPYGDGRSRVPVIVGGDSRPARRRAARWDGWSTGIVGDPRGTVTVSPSALAAKVEYVLEHRVSEEPFDVIVEGYSDAGQAGVDLVGSYADSGMTWWCDSINGLRAPVDALLDRIAAGPPQL